MVSQSAKINDTFRFLDFKNIDLDIKIVILSALVQKLQYIFLQNDGQCKVLGYVSRANQSRIFLICIKAPT